MKLHIHPKRERQKKLLWGCFNVVCKVGTLLYIPFWWEFFVSTCRILANLVLLCFWLVFNESCDFGAILLQRIHSLPLVVKVNALWFLALVNVTWKFLFFFFCLFSFWSGMDFEHVTTGAIWARAQSQWQ